MTWSLWICDEHTHTHIKAHTLGRAHVARCTYVHVPGRSACSRIGKKGTSSQHVDTHKDRISATHTNCSIFNPSFITAHSPTAWLQRHFQDAGGVAGHPVYVTLVLYTSLPRLALSLPPFLFRYCVPLRFSIL